MQVQLNQNRKKKKCSVTHIDTPMLKTQMRRDSRLLVFVRVVAQHKLLPQIVPLGHSKHLLRLVVAPRTIPTCVSLGLRVIVYSSSGNRWIW